MKTPRILFAIALLNASISWAGIYKHVDENGTVTFSAEPKPGAKKLRFRALLWMTAEWLAAGWLAAEKPLAQRRTGVSSSIEIVFLTHGLPIQ